MKTILNFLFPNLATKGFTAFGPAKRTVNGAMVHFNKALSELEEVERLETQEAERREREIAEALAAQEASKREAERAREVAGRIRTLIGADVQKTV